MIKGDICVTSPLCFFIDEWITPMIFQGHAVELAEQCQSMVFQQLGRRVLKNINSSGGTWGHHGTHQAEMGTPLTPSIPCIPAALPEHLSIDNWRRHFPRPILVQEIHPFCINPHVKKT